MSHDYIRYDILTQEALRGVVRTVLADVAAKGLPGDHHFYVTFDTCAEGVHISPRLQAQYPTEMTIVLQHQFWDLIVTDDSFEVGLSFKGVPERLVVPLSAIKSFVDPSVQFGLQFAVATEEAEASEGGKSDQAGPAAAAEAASEAARTAGISVLPDQPAAAANPPPEPDGGPQKPTGGEVVRLDRFRKK